MSQSLSPITNATGRGVRIAIIDSGAHANHPHVAGVAGGVGLTLDGETADFTDRIGHGTAVAGALREKAPGALLFPVRVFEHALTANIDLIIRALEWAIEHDMHLVNLSLGTLNAQHREKFERVVRVATERGTVIVAAREINGQPSLPGVLPQVLGVGLDWTCPREEYRYEEGIGFLASGYARPVPGVPLERNLNGISFAVAQMTGFAARVWQLDGDNSIEALREQLRARTADGE